MPHLIMGNISSTRIVATERTREFFFEYYAPLARGEPLTPELLAMTPDPYYVEPPERGDMPEIFGENLGVWTVKDTVKEIIEELEPGVHTFIPVNLRVRKKIKDYGQYYLLYVGQAIDAVLVEETRNRGGLGPSSTESAPTLSRLAGDIVLDRELVRDRHLWRGGRGKLGGGGDLFSSYTFCSDELKKRLKNIEAEGWRFRPCKLDHRKTKTT